MNGYGIGSNGEGFDLEGGMVMEAKGVYDAMSYRAGHQDGKQVGVKEGRKEAVDWFMRYGGNASIHYSDGVKARFDPPFEELQEKLKEWGIA